MNGMMSGITGMMGGGGAAFSGGLLALLTWLALVAFLVLGAIYFWRGINK